mmetsp:Transcript_18614/g.44791  ORF Transcript_18614/g.44791 Transcript_18614/m.44791 type:complete len:302 (+) Transcript_18614:1743-2648(+)
MIAAIWRARPSSSSSRVPEPSTSILSKASSAVVGRPPPTFFRKPLASANFSDGAMLDSSSVNASSSPPMRSCLNPRREKLMFMERINLFRVGVDSSASTWTSRSSTSSARAMMRPAMVRAPNFRSLACFFFLSLDATPMMASDEPIASEIPSSLSTDSPSGVETALPMATESSSSSEPLFFLCLLLSPLPNPSQRNGFVPFLLIFSFSNVSCNAFLVPPMTPSNRLLSIRSRCSLDCSSRPSRSWDLKRMPSSMERALRFAHIVEDVSSSSSSPLTAVVPLLAVCDDSPFLLGITYFEARM